MDKTKVIAISGASGCGKTSLVKVLAARFSCPSLHFDDHVEPFSYPHDMKKWHQQGANVSEIKTPKMLESLHRLMAGEHQYIFVEEPFGRERSGIAPLVDFVVLLDLPLELCLSRVLRRNISNSASGNYESVARYLAKYQDHFREIYLETVKQVRENCDLIVDKKHSVATGAEIVANWLINKKPLIG